eukprot:766169-Hanusia_phi.AAC.2
MKRSGDWGGGRGQGVEVRKRRLRGRRRRRRRRRRLLSMEGKEDKSKKEGKMGIVGEMVGVGDRGKRSALARVSIDDDDGDDDRGAVSGVDSVDDGTTDNKQ